MGIEEFDPISQPKVIRSLEGIKKLPKDKQVIIEARDNKDRKGREDLEVRE